MKFLGLLNVVYWAFTAGAVHDRSSTEFAIRAVFAAVSLALLIVVDWNWKK